jgi:hypothetical protein
VRGLIGGLGVVAALGAPLPPLAPGATIGAQEPGSTITVSIITFGQGDAVFEQFGHNALRIQDPAAGIDLAYNWGMFSFDQPKFIRRFLSGDTRYWVEGIPTPYLLQAYAAADRETHEQELALTPAQRAELAMLAAENALEANRYYRYDYFLDNCSTRIRDLLDRVLDGSLKTRFTAVHTTWSYRSESTRLTASGGLVQAGMDIALGPRADAPLTAWEAMFIPMRLRDYLREVTVVGADGRTVPLVVDERVLYRARRAPELAERRGLSIGAWGPLLGAWMLILAPVGAASRRRSRIPAAVMAAAWYGFIGVMGLLVLGMWLGSAHVFWYDNLNVLLLSPLGLVAAFPAARAVWRQRLDRPALLLVGAMTAMSVAAALIAPFNVQRMAGPLLLVLPGQLGLAVAIWRHTRAAPAVP